MNRYSFGIMMPILPAKILKVFDLMITWYIIASEVKNYPND